MRNVMEQNDKYSFWKGVLEVKRKDQTSVRMEIMSALHITTMQAYRNRRAGKVVPTIDEKAAIDRIFFTYGVDNPWGGKE